MGQWVKVAQLPEVPEGEVRVVEAGGQRIALSCVGGSHYAIQEVCTHADGPLSEGTLNGEELECPWHGARFNVKTGQAVTLPAAVPVKTFPVRVTGDDVYIQVD